jgi:transcriptional regulator with XRE-family HTH domain
VPLPEDRGRQGDARPKTHRFRSLWLELGRQLRAFRERYGVTQDEVARAVEASDGSTVTQWENGVNVPDGIRRERVVELLAGKRWPALRSAALTGDGLPVSWDRGVRWYRRASRERRPRETLGRVVAALLDELRAVVWPEELRQAYCERDGEWARAIADRQRLGEERRAELRRLEDAAFGLRWLEPTHGVRYDLRRSLVAQLPLELLDASPPEPPANGVRGASVTNKRKRR